MPPVLFCTGLVVFLLAYEQHFNAISKRLNVDSTLLKSCRGKNMIFNRYKSSRVGCMGQKEKLRCDCSGVFEERKAGEVLVLYRLDAAGFGILFCLLHFVVPIEPVVWRLQVLLGIFLVDSVLMLQVTGKQSGGIAVADGNAQIFQTQDAFSVRSTLRQLRCRRILVSIGVELCGEEKLCETANRIWGYSSAGRALEWHSTSKSKTGAN